MGNVLYWQQISYPYGEILVLNYSHVLGRYCSLQRAVTTNTVCSAVHTAKACDC